MLTDPEEIRIIAKARQKNVQDPNRPRNHFTRIFSDFLVDVKLNGANLLDLGPGQYDFAVITRERGALTYGIDNDEAVVELGRYKGLPIAQGNIKEIKKEDFECAFDGIFCKFSINAFWFYDDDERHRRHIEEIIKLIKPGGWAWIAPWNGVPKKAALTEADMNRVLSLQAAIFKSFGFDAVELTEDLSKYYGVHGATANKALFSLNLRLPRTLEKCKRL